MATEIKITKDVSVKLSYETQTSTKGRPFRHSGTRMNTQYPQKYINGMFRHHFFHTFIYLDEKGGFFEIECDYENKYIPNSLRKL